MRNDPHDQHDPADVPEEGQGTEDLRAAVKAAAAEKVDAAHPLSVALGAVAQETGPKWDAEKGQPVGEPVHAEAHQLASRAHDLSLAGLGRVGVGEHPVDVAADELGVPASPEPAAS